MKAHLVGLFSLLLSRRDTIRLATLVEESRQRFVDDGEEDLWWFWKGQVAIVNGEMEEGLALAAKIKDEAHRIGLKAIALREIAKKTGDPSRLVAHLEQVYAMTQDGLYLFELCEAKLQQKEWLFVANHASELLNLIGTPAALRIALSGAHNVGKPQQCLDLLNNNAALFPNGELPIDLKRLRVACEQQLGLVDEAIREAELVARESGQLQDLSQVVGLRLAGGDIKGAAETARAILSRTDADPKHLLQLARSIRVEDSHLAQELLSKAIDSDERSPSFVAAAYDLAFRLNREDIIRRLHPDFAKAAAESKDAAIRSMTLAEVVEFMESERKRQIEANQLYQKGRVPIHVIQPSMGAIYHERFHSTGDMLGERSPVFIRHGGRRGTSGMRGVKCLYVDVTALLLAAELDILDAVEKEFAPLYVPPSITYALHRQEEEAAPNQPSQIEAMQVLQELVDSEDLRIADPPTDSLPPDDTLAQKLGTQWSALFHQAKQQGGYVVDYLPLKHGIELEQVELGEDESRHVTGCGSILLTLTAEGKLTQEMQQPAREHLAATTSAEHPTVLAMGTALFLSGNIAETLASAGILREACKCFHVYIEADEAARVKLVLRQAQEQAKVLEQLRSLRNRISRGLTTNRYKFFPVSNTAKADNEVRKLGFEAVCLQELFQAEGTKGNHVWIDDRFINAFQKCGELPVITVLEVLSELRNRKALDDTSYFRKLHQLRKGNFRYLPLDKEEILFDLQNTSEKEGEIVETPELSVLRRYVAMCLQDRDRLQLPGQIGTPNKQNEVSVVATVLTATGEAVHALWCDKTISDGTAAARADWILHSLWFDSGAMPRLTGAAPRSPQEQDLMGATIAMLYFHALSMPSERNWKGEKGVSPRVRYFAWLQSRFASDWEFNQTVARQLTRFFETVDPAQREPKKNRNALRFLFAGLYTDLPQSIRSHMKVSHKRLKGIGIKEYTVVTVADWKFEAGEFWRAAAKAAKGGEKPVAARDPNQAFMVRFVSEKDGPAIQLRTGTPEKRFQMSDPVFDVLRADIPAREAVLKAHREWFDCEKGTREKHIKRLARFPDPSKRISGIIDLRNSSAAHFYANFQTKLDRHDELHLSDFEPPPSQGLLNHLRLPNWIEVGQFATVVEGAAKSLIAEEGFAEAFLRFASLPVDLPDVVWESYTKLSPTEQSAWREQALRTLVSPVTRLHILSFILRRGVEEAPVAADVIDSLLGAEGETEYSAFEGILRWTLPRLEQRNDTANWSPPALLAASWLHATRLHSMLRKISSKEQVAEFFENASRPVAQEAFGSRLKVGNDLAHPRQLTRTALLARGISAILAKTGKRSVDIPRLEEQAMSLCFFKPKDQWMPRVELLADPTLQGNAMNSFFNGDQAEVLAPLIGSETAKVFSSAQISTLAEAVLSDLLAKPAQVGNWGLAFALLGRTRAPDSLRERVRAFLVNISFTDLEKLELQTLRTALFTIINQVNYSGDEDGAKRIRAETQKLFQRVASRKKGQQDDAVYASVLVECAQLLALRLPDPVDVARELADFLVESLDHWPAAAANLQPSFARISYRLPPQVAVELWRLVFKIRQTAT